MKFYQHSTAPNKTQLINREQNQKKSKVATIFLSTAPVIVILLVYRNVIFEPVEQDYHLSRKISNFLPSLYQYSSNESTHRYEFE